MNKKKTIDRLNKVRLKDFSGIRIGDALQLCILSKMSCAMYLKRSIHLWVKSFCTYPYRVLGDGNIAFLFLSNQLKNPHIHQKLRKAAKLCGKRIHIQTGTEKRFNVRIIRSYKIILWSFGIKEAGFRFWESFYYACCLFQIYSEFMDITAIIKKTGPRLVCSIHNVRLLDSLCIQFAKNQGIVTAALPHTTFRLPEDDVEYYCSNSDYFLVADDQMRMEAEKTCKQNTKIRSCCLPQYIGRRPDKFVFGKDRVIGLFLGFWTEQEENKAAIKEVNELCKKYDLKYYVKGHPSDDIEKYKPYLDSCCMGIWTAEDSLEKCFSSIDISVTVNQCAVFLDSIFAGRLCFRRVFENVKKDKFAGSELVTARCQADLKKHMERYYSDESYEQTAMKIRQKFFLDENTEAGYRRLFSEYV